MDPKKWIASKGHTPNSLAVLWGVSASTVWRPVTGKRPPSWIMIVKFRVERRGRVGIDDWRKALQKRDRKTKRTERNGNV